jgi:hypothetical protein
MAAVFLDIEEAFDTTWHSGLLDKLSKLKFPTILIKLIGSFFPVEIQCFGRRRNVYAKGNASRVATVFCLVPNSIQYVYK